MKATVQNISITVLAILLSGCTNNFDLTNESDSEQVQVESNFNYETVQSNEFTIDIITPSNATVSNILVKVYYMSGEEKRVVFKGFSNESGSLEVQLSLPTWVSTIFIEPQYIGLPTKEIEVSSLYGQTIQIGGEAYSKVNSAASLKASTVGNYFVLGTWDGNGVPNYLEPKNDVITQTLLDNVNASLPEGTPLPISHPQYLEDGVESNLNIIQEAEIWVTFVHEGAGWKNVLGYYTYPTGSEPQSVSDLTNRTIIFPNTSFAGSGGGLISGNKVQLQYYNESVGNFQPNFPAGVTVGWFLIGNAWTGSTIGSGNYTHYSNKSLNIESDATIQQHNVLLFDAENELLLLAFEDIRRDATSCDQDFNDAVFYATASPITAVETSRTQIIDKPTDSDNDGVTDVFDAFPFDNTKATINTYPADGVYGSLLYEDLWPHKGDYDFNDMVIDYQISHILNASNGLVAIESNFVLRAIGAGFQNGFAFELPITQGAVQSVSGAVLNANLFSLNANRTESGVANTVVPVFDNAYDIIQPSGGSYVNTLGTANYVQPDTVRVTINLSNPISTSATGLPPYNPFIVVDGNREVEVHLPNSIPTSKANASFFSTGDDNSSTATGVYYTSEKYLPWAMNVPESFSYPFEKSSITNAYLMFQKWAESGGYNFMDWYMDKPGYRNNTEIYSK